MKFGTAVLATGFCVGWSVHVAQEWDFLYPQRIGNDMHMNAAVVIPIRMGAYKGLAAGKMLFTELLPQHLRPVYGQAVVCPLDGENSSFHSLH